VDKEWAIRMIKKRRIKKPGRNVFNVVLASKSIHTNIIKKEFT